MFATFQRRDCNLFTCWTSILSCKLGQNDAEANVVVAVVGAVVVTVRHTTVVVVVVPATATIHAVRAFTVTTLFNFSPQK